LGRMTTTVLQGIIMTTDNKVGRPRIEITEDELHKIIGMVEIFCTQDEICSIYEISEDTLDRRLKEYGYANFADFYKKHSGVGKQSLRRLQWNSAKEGSIPMQIWLGKQALGQSDKQIMTGQHTITAFEVVNDAD